MEVDVVIVGGGIAGLWTLDEMRRRGLRGLLLENRALGFGQTIASQGIIHGGLKYSLTGLLTASANEIREMPLIWREALSGNREPNLARTAVRSHCCYLWQTAALSSQAGMLGAQLNLCVKPQTVAPSQRPEPLRAISGQVFRLDEQVLSPGSLLECFRQRNAAQLLQIDEKDGLTILPTTAGDATGLEIRCDGRTQTLRTRFVIFTAGAGNESLSDAAGKRQPMQRRPLHMVLLRGDLPSFQGHCIDGAKTRLTITSEVVGPQSTVWQLGGQIAETGVTREPAAQIAFAASELRATLPGLDLSDVEWATYRIDRAERKSGLGLRPDTPQILRRGNVFTCWPTKLAFAPRLAESLTATLLQEFRQQENQQLETGAAVDLRAELADWPVPAVAAAPWEEVEVWYDAEGRAIDLPEQGIQPQAA